jgi:DNA-binding NarL/FixJ family response regulator
VAQISPEIMHRLAGKGSDAALYAESGPAVIENLTTREREVLVLLLEAKTNGEISETFSVSEQTVKNHVHNLYEKLGVSGRLQLLKLFSQSRR